jgi:hypothetical protein
MDYAACILSVVPVRLEPSHKSELINQILFGDTCEILETSGDWVFCRLAYDDYQGWVEKKQLMIIDEKEYIRLNSGMLHISTEHLSIVTDQHSSDPYWIVAGSLIPEPVKKEFHIFHRYFRQEGTSKPFEANSISGADIYNTAMSFLHSPYLWGGKTFLGFDCSGFTQVVYRLNGIRLLRDAYQQATQGEDVSFLSDAVAGDLLFFDNDLGKIIHAGIYLGESHIIHASGKVRVDKIDHQGIFNFETNKYTHSLRLIRRIL